MMKFLTLCTALAMPVAAAAQNGSDYATLDVLPGWRMDADTHMAGLRITLQSGWKTYWRAPGDAGIPPRFSFAGSQNIATVAPHWPIPNVFSVQGQRSIGYRDSVVFPIEIAIQDEASPLRVTGQIDIGVCEEICIPVTLTFDAALPDGGSRDPAITAALINRPLSADEAAVGPVTCTVRPARDGLQLTARVNVPPDAADKALVIETRDPMVWISEPDISYAAGTITATVDMVHMDGSVFAFDRSGLRMTLIGADRTVELWGCEAP